LSGVAFTGSPDNQHAIFDFQETPFTPDLFGFPTTSMPSLDFLMFRQLVTIAAAAIPSTTSRTEIAA
jgi:hypothetical protein